MDIKLRDIVEAMPALDRIRQQKPKNAKIGYLVARNIKKIERKLEEDEGYNDKRNDLVFDFGEENKDGTIIVPQGTKKMMDFNKALNALTDEEIEVDLWAMNLDKILDAGIELTVDDITRLFFLLDDIEEGDGEDED
jgi:hypothetical protein